MKLVNLSILAALFVAPLATASNYPAHYPLVTDCQHLATVKVCRSLQYDGGAAFSISYDGPLAGRTGVTAKVTFHWQDGSRVASYPMVKEGTGIQPIQTLRLASTCIRGVPAAGCAEPATAEMKHQLFWAKHGSALNATSLDVVFTADGHTDDRYGRRYAFWFPERGLSY